MTRIWHRNTAVPVNSSMTIDQQLDAAGLNWEVVLGEALYRVGDQVKIIPGRVAAYRSDTGAFIDIYQHRQAWQNREVVTAFNEFLDAAGMNIEYLGSLDKGTRLYAATTIKKFAMAKDVGDVTSVKLVLEDGHKRGKGLTISTLENRLVCTNGMVQTVKVRNSVISHRGAFKRDLVQEAVQQALDEVNNRETMLNELSGKSMDVMDAQIRLIKEFGIPGVAMDDQPRAVQKILALFQGGGLGSEMLTAYNTAYGLLQSVTEYYNWGAYKTAPGAVMGSILGGPRANTMAKFERSLCQSVGVAVR